MTTLKEYLDFADELYSSVDLRSILIFDDEEWKNVFTLAKFSIYPCENVIKEQELLIKKLGKINDDKIKIFMKSIEINQIEELTKQIDKGYLHFGDVKSNFICKEFVLDDLPMGKALRYYLGELSEYPSFHASVRASGTTLSSYRGKIDNQLVRFGFSNVNDIFPSYFDMERYDFQENIVFSFPIHCKIISMILHNNYELEVNIKINSNLINNTTIWFNQIEQSRNQKRIIGKTRHYARDCISKSEANYGYIKIRQQYDGLKHNEIIDVLISNLKIGIISDRQLYIKYASNKDNNFDQAFSIFDAGSYLEYNLLDENDSDNFEIAVSWIFELLNIRNVHLGRAGERFRKESEQTGSADILAYNDVSNVIYAIDCTIAPPRSDKIDRIRNTSLSLASKLGCNVRPYIVCSAYCPNVKKTASQTGVVIIDKEDLQKMFELLKNPNRPWELSNILDDETQPR